MRFRNKSGIEPVIAAILLIIVTVVVTAIFWTFIQQWVNNTVNKLNETFTGIGYLEIEKIETKIISRDIIFKIYITPVAKPVKINYIIITYQGSIICRIEVDKVIEEPMTNIEIKCPYKGTGTYEILIYTPITRFKTTVVIRN